MEDNRIAPDLLVLVRGKGDVGIFLAHAQPPTFTPDDIYRRTVWRMTQEDLLTSASSWEMRFLP